ncbi:protein phosphatase 2c domain-containing protein, partial [Cystoisospora suis]
SALHLHRLLEEHLRSSQVVSSLSPLACELSKQSISRSLIESFHEIDTNYKTSFPGSKDGSTALVLFLRWIEDRRWL